MKLSRDLRTRNPRETMVILKICSVGLMIEGLMMSSDQDSLLLTLRPKEDRLHLRDLMTKTHPAE